VLIAGPGAASLEGQQVWLLGAVRALLPRVVAMEACSSAHHWARCLQALGIEVRLVSPHYVSPFVKMNKNDRNDADAIVEAACRPAMRFVTVKSVEQQDMQAAHRVRELLVLHRTALINQVRGLLGERGITIARSPEAFKRAMPAILERCEGELTSFFQTLLIEILHELHAIEQRIWQLGLSTTPSSAVRFACRMRQAPGIGRNTALKVR